LIEGRILERFGWTFDELDESDEGRTLRTVATLNSADAYRQTMDAIASHQTDSIPVNHWNLWNSIRQAMKEEQEQDESGDAIENSVPDSVPSSKDIEQ